METMSKISILVLTVMSIAIALEVIVRVFNITF
jgi:hypothetical protein